MPYELRHQGNQTCVAKQGGEVLKCYSDEGKAKDYLRALYANVHESELSELSELDELSMYVTKARLQDGKMVIKMTSSDTGKDSYDENMSIELFDDFLGRIKDGNKVPDELSQIVTQKYNWSGGNPYISLSHYRAGKDNVNVPGEITWIGRDNKQLKATGVLYDTPLGRAVFKSLKKDLVEKNDERKVRVSIGFFDLGHSHGDRYNFVRKSLTDKCPLCAKQVGDKIYKKGCLVHLALTRWPANPRTDVEVERSIMTTKREDLESIVEDEEVVKGLDLRSQTAEEDLLVVKSVPDGCPCKEGDQKCIDKWKNDQESKSEDTGEMMEESVVVEEAKREDVSAADKKAAEKEYGNVQYADPENKKYPIDTEEHIRAAWNYIHQQKNADKYSDNGAMVKKHILSAWKKVIGGEPPSATEKSTVEQENTVFTSASPIEKSFAALQAKISELKSQGVSGEDALKAIQGEYAQVGEVIKAEFTPPPTPEELAAKSFETTLRSLLDEKLPALVAPIQARLDSLEGELRAKSLTQPQLEQKTVTTVQRSIPASAAQKSVEQMKQISQFDLIARKSVGLQ